MSWTHLSDKTVKASKNYQCMLCCERIEIGESHVNRAGVLDGEFCSSRMHVECDEETKGWKEDDWECFSEGELTRPAKLVETQETLA